MGVVKARDRRPRSEVSYEAGAALHRRVRAGSRRHESLPSRTSLHLPRPAGYPVQRGTPTNAAGRYPRSTGHNREKITEKTSTEVDVGGDTTEKPKTTRKADPLWDTFVEICGYTPSTKNARGKWNAGLAQLREAGATADTLKAAIKSYRREWPEAEISPTALATWWDRFVPKQMNTASMLDSAVKLCRQYDAGSALEDEVALWVTRGVDETQLRDAIATATPPIEKLAAVA
jgi:hypothetical protein